MQFSSPLLHPPSGSNNRPSLTAIPRGGAGALKRSMNPRPECEAGPQTTNPGMQALTLSKVSLPSRQMTSLGLSYHRVRRTHVELQLPQSIRPIAILAPRVQWTPPPFALYTLWHCKLGVGVRGTQVAGRCQDYKLYALGFLLKSRSQGQW